MKIDSLTKLYVHELKDIYSAESQVLKMMPDVIEATQDEELRRALREHLEETRQHIERLEQIFKGMEFEPGGHRCRGMEGLLAEGRELMKDVAESDVVDAALIAICQRIEHYEMAAYGVARAFASKLGRKGDVGLLTRSIEEEGAADRTLTQLAEHHINFVATTV